MAEEKVERLEYRGYLVPLVYGYRCVVCGERGCRAADCPKGHSKGEIVAALMGVARRWVEVGYWRQEEVYAAAREARDRGRGS